MTMAWQMIDLPKRCRQAVLRCSPPLMYSHVSHALMLLKLLKFLKLSCLDALGSSRSLIA